MPNDFLFTFFCQPIIERSGYNAVNTIVYGIILLLVSFFIVYPVLHRKGIKFNFKFVLSLLPYILLGSSFRVLEDLQFLPRGCNPLHWSFYTFTPGIYIAIFAVTITALAVSILIAKKFSKPFHLIFGAIGLALSLPLLFFLLSIFQAWLAFFQVIALVLVITVTTVLIFKFLKRKLLQSKFNVMVLSSQILDGSATFVATQFYNCGEQHFLSNFVLEIFPFGFILIKIAFILLILYYVDKDIKSENLRGFIKVLLVILGFATGLRDLLTLGAGTCL